MWKLLLFAVVVSATVCDLDRIVTCMTMFLDRDGDGKINATEIDLHMLYQPCGVVYTKFMGSSAIETCDMDGDGYITQSDLEYEPVSCISNHRIQMQLCNECDKCNATLTEESFFQ